MPSILILTLNTRGRLAHEPCVVLEAIAVALRSACLPPTVPVVLLLTETHVRPDDPLPPLQGYSPVHSVPCPLARNGRGRGGTAIYVSPALVGATEIWGVEAGGTGVAWIRVYGVLDRPLHIAACYLPPSQDAHQRNAYYARLAGHVAAAHAAGYVALGGDFNGRIAGALEFEEGGVVPALTSRESLDMEMNPQGRALLEFCREGGLWIVNGRVPGDRPAQWTFHSISNMGATSVVDYVLLDVDLMSAPHTDMTVLPPGDCLDHGALLLRIGGSAPALPPTSSTAALGPSPAGVEYRIDENRIPAFAAAVAEQQNTLDRMVEAAEAATTREDLETAVDAFQAFVHSCAHQAGFPQLQPGEKAGDSRPPRPPGSGALRRRRRRLLRRGDIAAAAAVQRLVCAVARRHRRQKQGARVKRLLEWRRSDPSRFYRALRGVQPGPAPTITASNWLDHFRGLLGTEPQARAADFAQVGAVPPAPSSHLAEEAGSQDGSRASAAREAQESLQAPFTETELGGVAGKLGNRKAVLGALKPLLLKSAATSLMGPLTALLNACVRLGSMPHAWAVSALTPIRKPKAAHEQPTGYRGIAVGTLPAKLMAAALNARITAYLEAAGLRAPGQAGFRKGFGCSDQILALRAIIERQRARGQRLYACFVDFKQAFDRVPRDLLWRKLQHTGISGWTLQAVQSLYCSVPMCVKLPAGFTACFPALLGVKQGCPLSPTLFGVFLDDFEPGLMEKVGAEAAGLPKWESGRHVPPLFYADDQVMLAISPEGLERQLGYLSEYCAANGLEVNTSKTEVVVYASRAPRSAPEFTYDGAVVNRVPTFKYLGVHLHQSHAFCSAGAARAEAGRQAVQVLRRRMAQSGLHAHPLLTMQLFDVFVQPVMSFGAEVWGPQLVVAALSGKDVGACERIHLSFLRKLLGVSDTCSGLTVLAETGRMPLAVSWAQQTARFLNRLIALDDSRVAKQALMDSAALAAVGGGAGGGRQCWAAEVGVMCGLLGQPSSLISGVLPDTLDIDAVQARAVDLHVQRYRGDAVPPAVARYCGKVLGGAVQAASYTPASYIAEVPHRGGRATLARLRLGCSFTPEDVGRTQGLSRTERPCPHCAAALGSAGHVILHCPHYSTLRGQFPHLFGEGQSLPHFFGHEDQVAVARFAELCYQLHTG